MKINVNNFIPWLIAGALLTAFVSCMPMEPPVYDIYIGVEGDDDASYLKRLVFDTGTNEVSDPGAAFQLTGNQELRGMDTDSSGNIVVVNFTNGIETVDISDEPASAGVFLVDHGDDTDYLINNYHTLCTLPNGNLLIGDYPLDLGLGKVRPLNEYDAEGVFIRNVYETPDLDEGYSAVSCLAVSNNEIFVSEGSRGLPLGGRMLRFTRASTSADWTLSNEFNISDFDEAQVPPTSDSGIWMMTVDSTHVYVARYQSTGGTEFKKLIRCPRNFDQGSCVGYGDDVPLDAVIKSLVPVPGTGGDLLVLTHAPTHKLYLFDSAGLWTELYDLSGLDLGGAGYSQIWANAILK